MTPDPFCWDAAGSHFRHFVQFRFWKQFFTSLSVVVQLSGSQGGPFLINVCQQSVIDTKVAPSLLRTLMTFELYFEGLGPPGGFETREKQLLGMHCFLNAEKGNPTRFLKLQRFFLG